MGKKIKRNQSMAIYQLEPLGIKGQSGPLSDGPLESCGEYIIQGEIKDHVIVSVPLTMTQRSAMELTTKLRDTLDKPVILVTHNMHFLKARKLSFKDAVVVNKRTESKNVKTDTDPDKIDEMGRVPAKVFGTEIKAKPDSRGPSDFGAVA